MRLVSVCLCATSLIACATLSDRPSDLQPAIVFSDGKVRPQNTAEAQWDECFGQALASAPGLTPRLAQDCCLSSRVSADVLVWCQRHMSMLKQRSWNGDQDVDALSGYHRWIREGTFCRFLKDQKTFGGTFNVPVTDAEIAIQCRLSDSMGIHFKADPASTTPPRQ